MILIKPNNFAVNEYTKNDVIDSVQIIPITDNREEFFDIIREHFYTDSTDKRKTLITETIFTNNDFIYQACFIETFNGDVRDMNLLASIITPDMKVLYGDVFIIKFTNDEKNVLFVDCTLSDVHFLLEKRLSIIGIIIKTDDSISEFQYNNHQFANKHVTMDEIEAFINNYFFIKESGISVIYDDINICGYTLQYFHQKSGEFTARLNNTMTKICGKKIYGHVVIINMTEHCYFDLTATEWLSLQQYALMHSDDLTGKKFCLAEKIQVDEYKSYEKEEHINNKYLLLKRALAK